MACCGEAEAGGPPTVSCERTGTLGTDAVYLDTAILVKLLVAVA